MVVWGESCVVAPPLPTLLQCRCPSWGWGERGGPLSCCKERDRGKRDTGMGSGCCVVLSPRVLPHTEVLYLE